MLIGFSFYVRERLSVNFLISVPSSLDAWFGRDELLLENIDADRSSISLH